MKKVFIDAGHGGKDPGALGNGLQEKDITLSIALKIGEILKRHNIEIVYSRTTDVFLDLTTRAIKANNAKADAFISTHVNSASNPKATGLEVWTSKGQTKGDILATAIGEQLQKDFPSIAFRKDMSDGDLDKEENFTVLTKTNMAAALVEYMFIVNPSDAQILRTKQVEFAESTAKGILKYLGVQYQDSGNKVNDKVKLNILGQDIVANGFFKDKTNFIKIGKYDLPVRDLAAALNLKNITWDNTNKVVYMK